MESGVENEFNQAKLCQGSKTTNEQNIIKLQDVQQNDIGNKRSRGDNDRKLQWNKHTKAICQKANYVLHVIQTNITI